MNRLQFPIILCVATVGLLSCGGSDEGQAPRVSVSDSAGTTIVTNRESLSRKEHRWRLDPTPSLTVGTVFGEEEVEFSGILGAVRLQSGNFVVADRGSLELRFYDGSGRFVRAVGGRGEGPGEFLDFESIHLARGDTIVVYDVLSRRLTRFDSSGRYLEGSLLKDARGIPFLGGIFEDGSALVLESESADPPSTGGFFFEWVTLVEYLRDGTRGGVIGRFPEREWYGTGSGPGSRLGPLPFGDRTSVVVRESTLVVARGKPFQISVLDRDGRLETLVRTSDTAALISESDIEEYASRRVQAVSSNRRPSERKFLEEIPFPAAKPGFRHMVLDRVGNVWIEDFHQENIGSGIWRVYDPRGHFLVWAEVPPSLTILDVGDDVILGRWVDELGVESIREYRIIK